MELARVGIPVRLIDKKLAPDTTLRAIGIQARALELFEQRGLTDEMLRLGNRSVAASIYGDGKRVLRLDYRHVDSRYDCILFLSQAELIRKPYFDFSDTTNCLPAPPSSYLIQQHEKSQFNEHNPRSRR